MTLLATASGKLILLGEYAVLDGAPALVAAIDRRAEVRISPASDGAIRVLAPDIGVEASTELSPAGAITWRQNSAPGKLKLVETALAATYVEAKRRDTGYAGGDVIPGGSPSAGRTARGLVTTLSTSAFFDSPGHKLGLGSSAALTVALAGGLRAAWGLPPATLAELVALHRMAQGGRGSGADVGAALTGGVIVYAGGDGSRPTARGVQLPDGVHWCCVFTGRSTSTPQFLAQLADWRQHHGPAYRRRIGELSEAAAGGIAAVDAAATSQTLAALEAYADGLDALGRDAGIDIMSVEHREIRNAARSCGVIYKPSGAGGGDIGIGFSGDPNHIAAFHSALSASRYRIIDMFVDARGLTVSRGSSATTAHENAG